MKNTIFFWLLLVFTIANIIDTITALFILPGEANPIFLYTGNIYIMFILKGFVILFAWYLYSINIFPSNLMYFMTIAALVFGSLIISYGAYSNIIGIKNPKLVEEASHIEKSEKIKTYFLFSIIVYIIPILLNIFTFVLYDKSYKKTSIDRKYFEKLKWWELPNPFQQRKK